jgi:hypothetical protein
MATVKLNPPEKPTITLNLSFAEAEMLRDALGRLTGDTYVIYDILDDTINEYKERPR